MNNHHPPPDYPGSHSPPHHHHQQHHGGRQHPQAPRSTLSHTSHTSAPASVRSGPLPPQQHTMVTVTTDPHPGATVTEINLNLGYYKTLPGILKLVQLVFGIICMACASPAREYVGDSWGVGHNHWFLFVVVTSFILTLLWSFFYLLQIKESIHMTLPFSWLKLEFFYTVLVVFLHIIAFIVILAGFGLCAGSTRCDARIAAGCFAIFNTIAYALGAYILYNDYKATPPELQ